MNGMRIGVMMMTVCAVVATLVAITSAQGKPYNATGTWVGGPGCPDGPCVIDLSQKGNRVSGTIGDLAAYGFQSDLQMRRIGAPWRGNYEFVTTTSVTEGPCNPAFITGTAHIDAETDTLNLTGSGTNTDCLVENIEVVLVKQ